MTETKTETIDDPPSILLVTDVPGSPLLEGMPVRTADQYLAGKKSSLAAGSVILNLCRSYQYLSRGYYVSLLADARGQRAYPSLEMIEQISNPFAYFRALREAGLDTIDFKLIGGRRLLPKVIVPESGKAEVLEAADQPPGRGPAPRYREAAPTYCEVNAIFGRTADRRFRRHAAAVYKVYSFPLLRIRMYREQNGWRVGQIFPITISALGAEEQQIFRDEFAKGRFAAAPRTLLKVKPQRIACLFDPEDAYRPSDIETIEKISRVALKLGALFETISEDDLARLPEYDALFIRTITDIDHYSFTFAQRAASLGMPVIDDPQSIMKCSNKVYLHELFYREGIPTPRTSIVSRRTPMEEIAALGFPIIIKLPQGSFSVAVKKAETRRELEEVLVGLFKDSPLLIVQEFVPTPFDWRITVLDGRVLFACRYHQAKDHWQIARRFDSGFTRFGKVEAVPLKSVPAPVKKLALRGAALIGDGLYGVDIKETPSGPLMIEINDNPNIDLGYEDAVEKDRVYQRIIMVFLRRVREAARPGIIA